MDDYLVYFALAGIVGLVTIVLGIFLNKGSKPEEGEQRRAPENANQNQRAPVRVARGNRGRRQRNIVDSDEEQEEAQGGEAAGDDSDAELEAMLNDPKLGAKKREKLKQKAEKKAQREADERAREEKKVRELKKEEERKKVEEQEAENERLKLEEEKRLREEQAQRDLEAYNQMKMEFTVEGEGCDVADAEEEENLLEKFVNHIKSKKVILFEELATQFGLKVPEAIDRVTQLVASERITGVMDDRGKFIYISEDELQKFAKFIKQRGRVSIAEIVENSTSIINIIPDQPIGVN
ncbi:unnamed protein product [Allacma fusca]|uniref:DDRGK domain-containing protein 1 n=1 Tax=Allacma fusca TaxID=39272 RepID=A0A8J2LCD0_9HEXA|nr:unnamed protein product [Allacma fusca]